MADHLRVWVDDQGRMVSEEATVGQIDYHLTYARRRDEEIEGLTAVMAAALGLGETPPPAEYPEGTRFKVVERDTYTGIDEDWWVAGTSLTQADAEAAVARAHQSIDRRYRYRIEPMPQEVTDVR